MFESATNILSRALSRGRAVGAVVTNAPALSPDEWREDLRHLARELPRRHKNAFHTVTRERFETAATEFDEAIPSLNDDEVVVGLLRLVALVGDARTELAPPDSFRRYPLSFYWFGQELRVIRAGAPYARALGARLVRIGEVRAEEAAARVNALVPRENEQWVRALNVSYLNTAEVLGALKILPDPGRGSWTFEGEDGCEFTLDVDAIAPGESVEWVSASAGVTPLYRQRLGEPYWFTTLTDSQTVYVNLKGYPDRGAFKRTSEELFKVIEEARIERLVVDLRQNRGGDYNRARLLLLDGLLKRTELKGPGRVYVIVGRATQSAAVVTALDFRKALGATIVGEPTGGRPNAYTEGERFELPRSRLKVSYATRYLKLQDEETHAVMPDQLFEPSWDAYRAGTDPALEWIQTRQLP
ncbi:MAG TPA: S41 family peptidase [Pyrinomonadaceae bacterium]